MNDLISRSALLRVLPNDGTNLVYNIRKTVENAPAVDVVPIDFHERCLLLEVQKRHAAEANQRHGRWVSNEIPESMLSKCSECGITYGAYSFNYCPNCGAKMGGKEDAVD